MEINKESLHVPNTNMDEVSQNKLESVINNKLLEESKDDDLCTPDQSYLEKNAPCSFQKDAHNESAHLSEGEIYAEANNEILNEESVDENAIDTVEEKLKKDKIEFSDEKNIQETLNYSVVSGNSSSDEEILQTRFSIQDEEFNSPGSPASFACVSDNESSLENDSEVKRPLEIQTMTYDANKSVDCKTNYSNFEVNEQEEKNDHQEAAIDRDNFSLSVDVDNSNIETESSYMQNSVIDKNTDLNFYETKVEKKLLASEIAETAKKEKNLDQNAQERNNISPDVIIEKFFNGSFDISIFKPDKNSKMIKGDQTAKKQEYLMKNEHPPSKKKKYSGKVKKYTNNKEVHNMLNYSSEAKYTKINYDNKPANDSTDDSMIQLKRKISEEQNENPKKPRKITGKNKDKVTDIISNKLTLETKSKLENKYSKANNLHKRVNNRSEYNEKDITILNNFDIREENSKKNKTKSNMTRTKPHKNEEIFKDFSKNIIPLKKSRNLRNSSLLASKKIKEIEKLENTYSGDEILLDSDSSCFDSNIKKIDDSFKSIFKDQKSPLKYKAENKLERDKFHQDIIGITSLESFQTHFEKQGKRESKRATRSNRKYENKFGGIFDACHKTAKCQLKMDNITPEDNFISDIYQPDFLDEENRDSNENYQNKEKKISNRQQSKSNKKTENKLLEYSKNIAKTTPKKDTKSVMNYGIITRSKKTWDTLEKELLGESNDVSFSNTVPLNKQSERKQSIKDVDLYSTSNKSMNKSTSILDKINKYDGQYKTQDTESKYLQTANNMQSNETVPYKAKRIVEKTIAAMKRCTAGFITPKENFPQKEWIYSGLEFDNMTDEMSIDQEAEFHSNVTFVTKENEQYFKNEIVTIVKQSSSIKGETPRKSATRTMYSGKYGFSDAEHLIKKSIITKSYSVEENSEESLKTKSQVFVPSSNKKQGDPWTRLIKELNLEQSNNENKCKAISNGQPETKALTYHENLKQHTNAHPHTDGEMQPTFNLNKRSFLKQDEIEKETNKQDLKQLTFEETPAESNLMADKCNDLNVEDNCITDNEPKKSYKNAEISSVSIAGKTRKTSRKMETKESRALRKKKVKKSPKFKLQVEDGSVKFKRCNRSFSSSSEESQKQRSTKQNNKKPLNDQQKYKRYLNNLFEKEKPKNTKIESMTEGQNSKKYSVEDKNKEQEKMIHTLIAKNDDDVFSISSSDSEPANKGTGLLCDMFDE